MIRTLENWLDNVDGEKEVCVRKVTMPNDQPLKSDKGTGANGTETVDDNSTGKSDCESGCGTQRPKPASTGKGKWSQGPPVQGSDTPTDPLMGHTDAKTDAPVIIPLCPVCNNPMVYKSARKG